MSHTPLFGRLHRLAREVRAASRLGLPAHAVPELRERMRPLHLGRREFVTAAVSAAGLLAIPRFARAAVKPRIAIVGAGIAGLHAALKLRDNGLDSTVYESQGRVGGRMFSNAGGYFNAGQVSEWCGEFIDTGHANMRKLAKRYELPLVDVEKASPKGSQDTFRFGGSYYTEAQALADFAPVLAAVEADADAAGYPTHFDHFTAAGQALDQMSVFDWIESRVPGGHGSPFGQLLDVAYDIEYGGETTDQSALNLVYLLGFQPDPDGFAEFGESDERFHIDGGNQQLPQRIAMDLGVGDVVRLHHRLVDIRQKTNGYALTFDTQGGTVEVKADVVLLTLPFAVLRDLDLSQAGFDALKLQAIDELGAGRNGKLQLQFKERLWNGAGAWPGKSTGSSYSDAGYQSSWDVTRGQPGKPGVFNVYTGSAVTRALAADTAFALASNPTAMADAQAMLANVETVFPGLTPLWNGKATSSRPHLNPNFRLAYSFYRVGQYTTFGGYENEPQGGVFFAGEHTSTNFQGFMEGGASEGAKAAKRIWELATAR